MPFGFGIAIPSAQMPREQGGAKPLAARTTDDELGALLQRCATGDHAAFRLVYDRWSPRLYGIALRITRQPSLAADAMQEAFVQAWQEARRYDPARGAASTWLMTLVRYRALDLVRRRNREVSGYEPPDLPDDSPDALNRLVGESDAEALRRCLDELEADRRQVLMLAYAEGLSHSTLAERLAQPLGTVKSWIRRSLMVLRECLES